MKKTFFFSVLTAILFMGGASHAHAQLALPSFLYDPIDQVLTITSSDGSPFTTIIGVDQLGNGVRAYNGAPAFATDAGIFGDAVGSEWLITSHPSGASSPPCGVPAYTGNPQQDFASCISAITSNGGTYELGMFGVISLLGNGEDPDVFVGDTASTSSTSSAGSLGIEVIAGAGGKGRLTANGFLVKRDTTMPLEHSLAVRRTNGQLLDTLLANQIVWRTGDVYTFRKNYIFATPSQPAALILNKLVDGWEKWKTADGTKLGNIYQQ